MAAITSGARRMALGDACGHRRGIRKPIDRAQVEDHVPHVLIALARILLETAVDDALQLLGHCSWDLCAPAVGKRGVGSRRIALTTSVPVRPWKGTLPVTIS